MPGGDRAVYRYRAGAGGARGGAEKLLRFNPNHYGPGPQGGQFAPSGEGGDGGGDGSLDPLDIGGDGGDDDGSDGSDDAGDDEPDVGSNDDSGLDDDSGDDDPVTPANNLPDANPDPGTAGGDPELVPASSTGMQLPYAQVAELVRENNVSDQSNELMLAIIWQESSFYPSAKNNFGTASGLMGVTQAAFADATSNYEGFPTVGGQIDIFDPATNVQLGSAYLQILIDRNHGDLQAALAQYGPTPPYPDGILAAANALEQDPSDPMAVLKRVLHK